MIILSKLQYDVLGKHLTRHYNTCVHGNTEFHKVSIKSSCDTLTKKENIIYYGLKDIKDFMDNEHEHLGLYGYASTLILPIQIDNIKDEITKKFKALALTGD